MIWADRMLVPQAALPIVLAMIIAAYCMVCGGRSRGSVRKVARSRATVMKSPRYGQCDKGAGGGVLTFKVPAAIDQVRKLPAADGKPGRDRLDSPSLFLKIPDKLPACAFFGIGSAVLCEDRD